ncbi:HK97 family phage prohead protease [Fictibacillus enclensis]|uniref:HK97 family phage prohead protease n=1 Tax=Fictibacillus enclensis TaxID=1017270 RepID=UPI0025A1F3C1|nr:HK97 family phage prohead protease [Fictibacillus enclensis]MDM5199248.1 HK97 family phage prohead protease [Fictibacillus enclensis]
MRIEIRGDQVILDGYVNAVDRESRVLPSPRGRFKEVIRPKTFQRALNKAENVELLFNHDNNRKLGSIQDSNLELYEDNIGLRAIATISDEEVIREARANKLTGWSFGFICNQDQWEDGSDGIHKRFVEDIDLLEVSILNKTPAYIATSVESRGEESYITEQRNEEFNAKVIDEQVQKEEEKPEETREEVQVDYSFYEKHLNYLKFKHLKG